ncbi:hypothetical protein [Kribbella sp. NPDC049584]|uniref:hypothetical protein n=1 Tax=Kribbella sp. NPDC049584 TaxID=3154833 RepID=UPI00342C0B20
MTTINWERESGEKVEDFVAAMLLLGRPRGNQITPSRGDKGIDIRIWNDEASAWDVYQVKRYSRPLASREVASVEESWKTFVEKSLPRMPVHSWNLVMPWDPTNDRLQWLEELTSSAGLDHVGWLGRKQLDGMAAGNPRLVDYYFGDGATRVIELMTLATNAGKALPSSGDSKSDLLEAVKDRHRSLAAALNEIDPFYRYEFEIRAGKLSEVPWMQDVDSSRSVAWIQYEQLDDSYYSILRLIPLSEHSFHFRPITGTLQLEAKPGTEEHTALLDFFNFGKPIDGVAGRVKDLVGPPGIDGGGGRLGRISFFPASGQDEYPDLELRLVSADGAEILRSIDLEGVTVMGAVDSTTGGIFLAAKDPSSLLTVEVTTGAVGKEARIHIQVAPVAAKAPGVIHDSVQFLASITDETGLQIAIRDGKPLTAIWQTHKVDVDKWGPLLKVIEALREIQRHTFERITMPDLDAVDEVYLQRLARTAKLLQGETLEEKWRELPLTYNGTTEASLTHEQFQVAFSRPLTFPINGREIELDMQVRYHLPTARLAAPLESGALRAGDSIRLVPGDSDVVLVTAVPVEPEGALAGESIAGEGTQV